MSVRIWRLKQHPKIGLARENNDQTGCPYGDRLMNVRMMPVELGPGPLFLHAPVLPHAASLGFIEAITPVALDPDHAAAQARAFCDLMTEAKNRLADSPLAPLEWIEIGLQRGGLPTVEGGRDRHESYGTRCLCFGTLLSVMNSWKDWTPSVQSEGYMMGQAKRRREATAQPGQGTCNGCKLCCIIPAILELPKAPFTPCKNLCEDGCSIHGNGQPQTCIKFDCRYILAHRLNLKDKDILPHPKEAGAYIALPKDPSNVVMYVDPSAPKRWQGSAMPAYLKTLMRQAGVKVTIVDRGYQFTLDDPEEIDAMAAFDMVEVSRARGLKPTYAVPGD